MIEVRTLGAAEIVVGRKRLTPKTEGLFALAVYLCVRAGEPSSRDALCEMFWPGSDPAKARHNLRQMLYRLRQAGIETQEEGDLVRVPSSSLRSDLAVVLVDGWPEKATADEVESASTFLPYFEPQISPGFGEWLSGTRATLASRYRRAVLQQLDAARREARWLALELWADRLLASDPLSEEGTFAKAESIAMVGSKVLAIELLDTYVAELGSHSTRIALPAKLLRRRIAERPDEWAGRHTTDVPLVGRAGAMRRLSDAIDSALIGDGSALLVHGAPGIGKTRLCVEARHYAALRGASIIAVRAADSRAERPLGLVTALAQLLYEQAGAAATSPAAMGVVRRLIDQKALERDADPGSAASVSLDHLAWALVNMARAAAEETPLLIHLDDLHNADTASLHVLQALFQSQLDGRIAVFATVRSHWLNAANPDIRCVAGALRLHIPPLSSTESTALVEAFRRAHAVTPARHDECKLTSIAGGNPLFLKELAARSQRAPYSTDGSLTLARVIEQRCAKLSSRELRLLRIVSLLGPLATIPRLYGVLGLSSSTIAEDVESLERDGLLSLEELGVLSLHECWRDAIESDTPPATRSALAYDCANALRGAVESGAGFDVEWHQGRLYSMAGDAQAAIACYRQSGARLMALGVPSQACEAYARALSLATEPADQGQLNVLHAGALVGAGRPAAAASVCREALAQLSRVPTPNIGLHAEATAILAEAEWRGLNQSNESLRALLDFAIDRRVPMAQRLRCAHTGIRLSCNRDRDFAKLFFEASPLPTAPSVDDWMAVSTHLIYETELGSPSQVRPLASTLKSLTTLPVHTRAMLLRHSAFALRVVGEWEAAHRVAEESLQLALEGGLPSAAISAAIGLAFAYLDHGLLEDARDRMELAAGLGEALMDEEQQRSLRHARSRYLLATGRYKECLEYLRPHIESIRSDHMPQRRALELACVAVSAAMAASPDLAYESVDLASEVLMSKSPPWVADFTADAVVAALDTLGNHERASSIRDDYVRRRGNLAERPIVPALERLRAAQSQRGVPRPAILATKVSSMR
ncbi:MAG: AAA family ATPase [Gemmatimonadetes bacterium]|nr:AAA family ATPase [Gemmatimonadota bacterium]